MSGLETVHLVAAVWRDGADATWELELLKTDEDQLAQRRVWHAEGRCDIDYAAVFGGMLAFERILLGVARAHDVICIVPLIDG